MLPEMLHLCQLPRELKGVIGAQLSEEKQQWCLLAKWCRVGPAPEDCAQAHDVPADNCRACTTTVWMASAHWSNKCRCWAVLMEENGVPALLDAAHAELAYLGSRWPVKHPVVLADMKDAMKLLESRAALLKAGPWRVTPSVFQEARDTFGLEVQLSDCADFTPNMHRVCVLDGIDGVAQTFAYHTELLEVILPPSVHEIGSNSFAGCTKLSSVGLQRGTLKIGDRAFQDCAALSALVVPVGVVHIGLRAFEMCRGLRELTLRDGVIHIGSSCFLSCVSLWKVVIPSSVIYIGPNAFQGCTALQAVTIPAGVCRVLGYTFADCTSLSCVTLRPGLVEISTSSFENCTSLTQVVIPEGVTVIGSQAFRGCSRLGSVTIPGSVQVIRPAAFQGCTSLSSVILRGNPLIWTDAFDQCPKLRAANS